MALITSNVPLTGPITPYYEEDLYPVTIESYNQGGYRTVSDEAARLAITTERRKEGMIVTQSDTFKSYILQGGITNSDWTEIDLISGVSLWQTTGGTTLSPLGLETTIEIGTDAYQESYAKIDASSSQIVIQNYGGTRFEFDSLGTLISKTNNSTYDDYKTTGKIDLAINKWSAYSGDASSLVSELYYDDTNKCWTYTNDITGSSMQIGRECWIRCENDSGSQISNGDVVYISGWGTSNPEIMLASNDTKAQAEGVIGVVTNDISDGSDGEVTRFGSIADIDTSGETSGAPVYLGLNGAWTTTRPSAPDYVVRLGVIGEVGVNGSLILDVNPFIGSDTDINIEGALNGIVTQTPTINFVVDGGVVYADVTNEDNPTDKIPVMIGGTRYLLDTLTGSGVGGAARVALTNGTSSTPQPNFIYVELSGDTAVLGASTTYPSGTKAWVCGVSLKDAATTASDGVFSYRRHNNAVDNGDSDGYYAYIAQRLRLQGSVWESGVNPTVAITNGGLNVNLTTTSGIAWQLHRQAFSATDGTEYYIVNHPTDGIKKISDLNEIDVDAQGVAIANNDIIGINIFGCQNSEGVTDRIFITLPDGKYPKSLADEDLQSIRDTYNYAMTSIPTGLGIDKLAFRICRLVLRYNTGGIWDNVVTEVTGDDFQDERGLPLGAVSGGGGGSSIITDFPDSNFTLYNNDDPTKVVDYDLSGLTTDTTKTVTMPDKSGTMAMTSDLLWSSSVGGIEYTSPLGLDFGAYDDGFRVGSTNYARLDEGQLFFSDNGISNRIFNAPYITSYEIDIASSATLTSLAHQFKLQGTTYLSIDSTGINVPAGNEYKVNGSSIASKWSSDGTTLTPLGSETALGGFQDAKLITSTKYIEMYSNLTNPRMTLFGGAVKLKLQALETASPKAGFVGTESNHEFNFYTNNIKRLKIGTDNNIHMLNDNGRLYFGAGDDASIYSDGTDLLLSSDGVIKMDSALNINSSFATGTLYKLAINSVASSQITRFSTFSDNAGNYSSIMFQKSHVDTNESFTATIDGEYLGGIIADGTNVSNTDIAFGASILFQQQGTAGSAQVPTKILLSTSNGSSSNTGIEIDKDRHITMPQVYSDAISGTYKTLYIDSNGKLGVVSSAVGATQNGIYTFSRSGSIVSGNIIYSNGVAPYQNAIVNIEITGLSFASSSGYSGNIRVTTETSAGSSTITDYAVTQNGSNRSGSLTFATPLSITALTEISVVSQSSTSDLQVTLYWIAT